MEKTFCLHARRGFLKGQPHPSAYGCHLPPSGKACCRRAVRDCLPTKKHTNTPAEVGWVQAFLREEGGTRQRDGRSLRDFGIGYSPL